MMKSLKLFVASESGATTVDWVVLTAALIGLAMIVLVPVAYSTDSATHEFADYIASLNAGYGNN